MQKTRTVWTAEELDFLKNNYNTMSHAEMGAALGKTKKSVNHKCVEFGLKKDVFKVRAGDRFGGLEALLDQYMKPVGKSSASFTMCRCECGREEEFKCQDLKKRTCCIECNKPKFVRDSEQRLNPTGNEQLRKGGTWAEYICECSTTVWVKKINFKTNKTKSCGCLNQDKRKSRTGDKNGRFKHGLCTHPLHLILHNIKSRCYNENVEQGHTGIEVCKEWLEDFKAFYDWAISNGWEDGKYISRKDYSLNYSPENCIVTTAEEIYNREDVKIRMIEGQKEALLEKYGVEYSRHIPGVNEKIQKTNLERYGHISPFGNTDIQNKVKATNIEKYGQETVPYELNKDKIEKTNLKKYGTKYHAQNEEVIAKQIKTRIDRGLIYIHEGLKASEWAEKIGICPAEMRSRIRQVGFEEAIKMPITQTSIEYLIQKILDKLGVEYIFNKGLGQRFPDFRIESHKLVIEADGLYYHCDAINKDNSYHKKKKTEYTSLGYTSLFFREHEIKKQGHIVESIIKNKLGLITNRIFARKTEVRLVPKKDSHKFFENNHLMGRGSGKTYGLYYNGILVSAMRIRAVKDYIDISRFCNIVDTNIIGGFSKLLSAVQKDYPNRTIKTFIDMRYGDGSYLTNLGFTKERESLSFKWVNDEKVYGRQTFVGNTGYDKGYYKIWDCGQALWVKEKSQT